MNPNTIQTSALRRVLRMWTPTAFVAAILPLSAQAQDIHLYEGFALMENGGVYTESALEGQGDPLAAGFSGGWSEKAFDGSRTIVAQGLDYTDTSGAQLVTADGALKLYRGARARRSLDGSGAFGDYSLFGSIGAMTGTTLYMSYLIQHDVFDGDSSEFGNEVAIFGIDGSSGVAYNIFLNPPIAESDFGSKQYFIRLINDNNLNVAFGEQVADTVHMVVVKGEIVEGDGNDVVSVYYNPDLSGDTMNRRYFLRSVPSASSASSTWVRAHRWTRPPV